MQQKNSSYKDQRKSTSSTIICNQAHRKNQMRIKRSSRAEDPKSTIQFIKNCGAAIIAAMENSPNTTFTKITLGF